MDLYAHAIEPYQLVIESNAPITALDASFDGDTTWVAGEQVDTTEVSTDPVARPHVTEWRWTVAGVSAPTPPAGAIVITTDVRPTLRAHSGTFRVVRPSESAINVK